MTKREKEMRWLELAGLCRKSDFTGQEEGAFSRCSAVRGGLHTCYKRMLAHTQQARKTTHPLLD